MNKAWLLVVAVGASGLVASQLPVAERAISADPASVGAVGTERRIATEAMAGAAAPMPFEAEPRAAQPRATRARTPSLPLDYVEPWTGEDLAPVLAAAAAAHPRATVDRRDPWDPSIEYPMGPPVWDPRPDGTDPWESGAAAHLAEARDTSRPKRSAKVADRDDPWASSDLPRSPSL
jgi:hypothetical protein